MSAGPALSSRAAAAYLSIGLTKLRQIVTDGELGFIDKGGMHLFLTRDLDQWLMKDHIPSDSDLEAARQEGMRQHRMLRKIGAGR